MFIRFSNNTMKSFYDLFLISMLLQEGDIIAYRLDIIDSLGCPGLSSFRVCHTLIQVFTQF
jgi:hypothetical protein